MLSEKSGSQKKQHQRNKSSEENIYERNKRNNKKSKDVFNATLENSNVY